LELTIVEPVQDLLRAARELQAAGDGDGAVRIYEEILEREPDHAGALHAFGVMMNRREDYRRAAGLLERAVVLRPTDPVRHVDLGESYRNLGEYRNAIGCCRTALRLRPEYPEGLNTLGLALQGIGDLRGALEPFRRAIALRPEFAPAHTNAGMVLQEIGAMDEALGHFRRAVELEPDSALTRTNLGLALLAGGRVSEALPHFQEAVRLSPDLAVVHHNLGNALRILGHHSEARASYLEAIRLDPNLGLSHFHIGLMLRREGSLGDAVKWCKLAVEREPDNSDLWEELADLHQERDEPDEADACRQRVGALVPADVAVMPIGPQRALREDGRPDADSEQYPSPRINQPDWAESRFCTGHIIAAAVLQEPVSPDEASGLTRSTAELEPDVVLARTNLGLAALGRGDVAEALPHFQEAARLCPDLAVVHHNLGNALRILGRPVEARASYLRAIRLDPHLAPSYLHVGMTLRLVGALDDALRWYKLAVDMVPDRPDFWEELAELHRIRDESDQAVECRRRVVELVPADRVDARIALGGALQDDGRPDEAMEQYAIARRIRPDSAQVHFALSGVHEEWGDLSEAESEVRAAIRVRPHFPAAYARLATLLRGGLPDDDLVAIEGLLADPELGSLPRARLLFAIAHVLDAREEYTRAAVCLREANALTLDLKRAEGAIYHADDHERFVDRLIRAFDRDFFLRTAGLGLATQRPVFVVGLPRSGTTLVEQILASHPRVYGAGERLFGRRSFESVPAVMGRSGPPIECVESMDEYALKRLAGEHLGKLNALDLGRYDRIVDKLPDNYLYIGLLAVMFPNAVFIHCRRDLRDIAVSCWISDFRSIRWANDPAHIGARFGQYRRLTEHWKRTLPARVLEVHYEDTVSDLDGVTRRLLDACGVDWDPACLDFHQTKRVVRTASLTQVRQPIYTSSVARWKHYESELAELFDAIAREGPDPV
jgi:tetratricopeptide (TPR) repeat protein